MDLSVSFKNPHFNLEICKKLCAYLSELTFRRLIIDNKCSRCQQLCESFTHVVRDCLFTMQIFSGLVQLQIQTLSSGRTGFWRIQLVIEKMRLLLQFRHFGFLETNISMRKRRKVEKGFGMKYQGSTLTLKHLKPRSIVKWMPHSQGWVKINIDAGLSVANKHAVSFFIIRNEEGLIMDSRFKCHNLVRSVVIAEAIAVLHGLQFALDLGFTNVILESIQSWLFRTYNKQAKITRNPNHSSGMRRIWRGTFLLVDFNSLREKGMWQLMQWLLKDEDSFWVEDAPMKVLEVAGSDRQFSRPP
ncbi:hypothetical protein CXB51_003193 [Gossypium anomalum]|uniref:RNase H type-1 domain-containing protein n=1 Tax=Gossypium anomalum TaxID=47600 RepID=A0A8J5ZGS8_9ROSI|nr:hypothetical protein CXB51_003193 [Gossypium anomalum]